MTEVDSAVVGGAPFFRDTRIPVHLVASLLQECQRWANRGEVSAAHSRDDRVGAPICESHIRRPGDRRSPHLPRSSKAHRRRALPPAKSQSSLVYPFPQESGPAESRPIKYIGRRSHPKIAWSRTKTCTFSCT